MMRKLLLLLFIAAMAPMMACCSPQAAEPQPTADLDQMIERTVHQWLDVRLMDQTEADALQVPDADWRIAASWSDLQSSALLSDLGSVLSIKSQIEGSSFYNRGPPSETAIIERVKAAIDSFVWEE